MPFQDILRILENSFFLNESVYATKKTLNYRYHFVKNYMLFQDI